MKDPKVEFHVVEHGGGDEVDFVVCALATVKVPFTDNVFDFCCKCGEKVQMRPYAPKVPKKICIGCALPDMEERARKGDDIEIGVSPEGAEFIRNWRAKQ